MKAIKNHWGLYLHFMLNKGKQKQPVFQSNLLFQLFISQIMTSLRHFNEPSLEDEDLEVQPSQNEESSQVKVAKSHPRPGRPRGKGRPKRSTNLIKNKKNQEQQEWQDRGRQKERANQNKQQSTVEGYIKIIDYLKKIDYDEGSFQNKMNPYNALTATSFWYTVSAQYFSFDFFSKNNPHDIAMDFLERINKLPLFLSNRVLKTATADELLSFETIQLNELASQFSQKLAHLIPSPLPSRPYNSQRKANTTTVTQDDLFISSTRTLLYNYLSKKIKNSEKWGNILSLFKKNISQLAPKSFQRLQCIQFQKQQEEVPQNNLFEILRQQARKKLNKKSKNKSNQKPKQKSQNDIYEQEEQNEIKEEQNILKQQNNLGISKILILQDIEQKIQAQKAEQNEIKLNDQNKKMQIQINQQQRKQIEEEIFSKQYIKIYSNQDLLLDSILKLPLDKIISILQSNLPSIQIPQIKEDFIPLPTKDPLEFVYQLHPQQEAYLQYMKAHRKKIYKQKIKNQSNIEEQSKQGHFEDAKCQICTDGDYTDDNLIVFCSLCNISLHQRCVGLAKVPAESWICDVCLAFGPAGINLACPLCNVKGGAMKRTTIHIDTNLFKELNPQYYEYSKRCPYNKEKQRYIPRQKNENDENKDHNDDNIVQVVRQKGQKQQECYYDYFVRSTYPTQEPVCHYIWVHYVCAIWIPQCYFQQKNGMINIKGIQNIEKRRFKNECFVCKKNRCGAAVKCQDIQCDKYYHPQCARKKKIYMEQLNIQRLKYLIFCQQHQPLKITRQIQYRKKKNREQIIKFARMIEKYIETYRIAQFPFKLLKSAIQSSFIQTVSGQKIEQSRQRKLMITSGSDEQFLKELINNLSKSKMMTVHLQVVENGYKISNIQTPSKRQIKKCLNRYDQFWNSIKNGESNEDNFRRYERIMLQNQKLRQKLQLFLNGSLSIRGQSQKKQKKIGKKRGKHATIAVETLIQEQGGIFCVCKKPYENETDMFQCEVCGQWYHFKCVGFIGTQQDVQSMEFKCMKCMKFEDLSVKDQRLKKYAHLFSPDSILYNYRPPTPELMSQQQIQPKNYTQIMHEFNKSKIQQNLMSPQKKQKPLQIEIQQVIPIQNKQIIQQKIDQQLLNEINDKINDNQ